ncbi:hypothetical protein JCM6882_004826 [Rhodosporidiobolus microsporus]
MSAGCAAQSVDTDDYILPFQLPGLSSHSAPPSSPASLLPQPPPLAQPPLPSTTKNKLKRNTSSTSTFVGVLVPVHHRGKLKQRLESAASSPSAADMETRRKRSSTLSKRRASADGADDDDDAVAAPGPASPDGVAARAPRVKRPPRPLPGEVEQPQRGSSTKAAVALRRTSYSASQTAQEGAASLKIVLKRNPAASGATGGLGEEASPSLPTPSTSSAASPPVVLSIDSTPGPTPSPSPSSSRSSSPAYIPAPSTSRSLAASTTGGATGAAARTVPTRSSAPLVPSAPLVALPYGGASKKAHQKNGKDGLNRVCHHHKSQTDRPRMTCVNAPECKTVWCSVCVEKYYLPQTPLNLFEPGGIFACPVCQGICSCAQCKRKRRGIGRDGNRRVSASAASALAPAAGAEGAEASEGADGERKRRKKGKGRKKDRKGKGRVVAGGAGEDSEDVVVPPPVPVSGRVRQMLAGMGALEAASLGFMGATTTEEEGGASSEEESSDEGEGGSSGSEGGEDEEGDVQRMLVDSTGGEGHGLDGEEEADEVPPLPASAAVSAFAVSAPPPPAPTVSSSLPSPAPLPPPAPPSFAYPATATTDSSLPLSLPAPTATALKPPAPPPKRKKKGGNRRRSRPLTGAAAAAAAAAAASSSAAASRRASTGSSADPSAPPAPARRPHPRASAPPIPAYAPAPAPAAHLPYASTSLFAPCPGDDLASSSSPYDPTDSPFSYGHPLSGAAPALSRPKRNKRPSSAFEDYAVDYASQYTSSSPVFNERVGDRNRAAARKAQQAASVAAAAASAAGAGVGGRGGQFPAYPTREEIEAAKEGNAKRQKRWRSSGISSAGSSCAGLSGDEYEADSLFGDEEEEAGGAGAGAAAGGVVGKGRGSKEEQPLPVLAGLERNLGLVAGSSEEGEEEDGDGAHGGVSVDLDGDASMLSYAGESFDVGVVIPPPPPPSILAPTPDNATAAPPPPPVAKRQQKVVKWIEGPERRKRREERDKAREGEGSVSPPLMEVERVVVKREEQEENQVKTAPPPPAVVLNGGEPVRPFGSPLLNRRSASLAPISTSSSSSSSSIAVASPSATANVAPSPAPSSAQLTSTEPASAPLTATEPDDAPPPYDSLVPSLAPSSAASTSGMSTQQAQAAAAKGANTPDPSTKHLASPNAALFPFPSSASPTQASTSAPTPAAAPVTAAAAAAAAAAVESRSAEDTRIAFRLLDAVRAATAGYGPPRPRPQEQDALDEAGVGAAMAAALTEGLGTSPSPTKPLSTSISATASPSSLALAPSSIPPRPISPAVSSTSSSIAATVPVTSIDPLEAQRLEAARRDLALAASAAVDPSKAFRREVRARARRSGGGAGGEFWLVAPEVEGAGAGEDEDAEEKHESVSERGAREFSAASSSSAVDAHLPPSAGVVAMELDLLEFELDPLFAAAAAASFAGGGGGGAGSPHLVEDLWTPSSVAETSLSLASGASTAASSVAVEPATNGLGINPSPAAGAAAEVTPEDEFQYFAGCLAIPRATARPAGVVVKQEPLEPQLSFEAEMEKEFGGAVLEWMEGVEEGDVDVEGEMEVEAEAVVAV